MFSIPMRLRQAVRTTLSPIFKFRTFLVGTRFFQLRLLTCLFISFSGADHVMTRICVTMDDLWSRFTESFFTHFFSQYILSIRMKSPFESRLCHCSSPAWAIQACSKQLVFCNVPTRISTEGFDPSRQAFPLNTDCRERSLILFVGCPRPQLFGWTIAIWAFWDYGP